MPKVSAEHRQQVRGAILDAAFACLLEEGVAGVTARAIGRRAEISPGTIYLYFDDKADLFAALAERVAVFEIDLLVGDEDQPAIDRLQTLLARLLAYRDEVPGVATLRELASRDPAVQGALDRFDRAVVEAITPLVRQAMADGSLRSDLDPEAVVETVDIFFEALSGRRFVTSRERTVRAFVELITEGSRP